MSTPNPLEDAALTDPGLPRVTNPPQKPPGVFGGLFHDDDYGYLAPLEQLTASAGDAASVP